MQFKLSRLKLQSVLPILCLLFLPEAYSMTVRVLNSCDTEIQADSIYTVLGNGQSSLTSWNHIANPEYQKEFSALRPNKDIYEISVDNYVPVSICTGSPVLNTILVVKLSDWTRQHSNGLEAQLKANKLTFGYVTHVLLDIRVNSADTRILNQKQLKNAYSEFLSPQQFDEFDQGNVILGISLLGDGALDQSSESLNSQSIVEINHSLIFDKWVRVLIPMSDFDSFTQKNYANTKVDIKDFSKQRVVGFRVNAETSQGNQLRNILGDQWSADIPELFKQISISFRRVELLSISDK